jgi:hypothetical protein
MLLRFRLREPRQGPKFFRSHDQSTEIVTDHLTKGLLDRRDFGLVPERISKLRLHRRVSLILSSTAYGGLLVVVLAQAER